MSNRVKVTLLIIVSLSVTACASSSLQYNDLASNQRAHSTSPTPNGEHYNGSVSVKKQQDEAMTRSAAHARVENNPSAHAPNPQPKRFYQFADRTKVLPYA
ncbi:MAG: hypothetical protein V3V61_05850 [Gammaproteobacteria bacterium]